MHVVCNLGDLPFYVGAVDTPHHHDLPDTLPFTIGVDDGRVMQMPNAEVSRALAVAYTRGSMIGTPLAPTGIGRRYADDFLGFLDGCDVAGRRVLDVGCGTGHLLRCLAERGATCVGVDPGAEPGTKGLRSGTKGLKPLRSIWSEGPSGPSSRPSGPSCSPARPTRITFIRDTFPSPRVTGSFDIIVHYCVLEHIEDPTTFLRAQVERLAPGGRIVIAVPNVEDDLREGDVAIFVHQHWSYFSRASLRRLLAGAGLVVVREALSGYGGVIYVEAMPGVAPRPPVVEDHTVLAAHIRRHIEDGRLMFRGDGSCGVFPACRAMNLLHLLRVSPCPRLFDDDPNVRGRYLPPLDRAIEPRDDLLANPVDRLIITSRSFGPALRRQLSAEPALAATRVGAVVDRWSEGASAPSW